MQPQLTRIEYLRRAVLSLGDDPALPWDAYPCLEWPFGKDKRGRGFVTVGNRSFSVRRIALEMAHRPLEEKEEVLSHCENKRCFRPIHLFARPDLLTFVADFERAERYSGFTVESPCVEWPYTLNDNGYGVIAVKKKWLSVPRMVLELFTGKPLGDLQALHHCDNPPCFRLAHLFPGTPAENMADMIRKNRKARGSSLPNTKLAVEDIPQIFDLYESGLSQEAIAVRYRVSGATIHDVLNRRNWKFVAVPDLLVPTNSTERMSRGEDRYNAKLTDDIVRKIRNMSASGMRNIDIVRALGILPQTVCRIIKRQAWKHVD